jgi:hypothetical protein
VSFIVELEEFQKVLVFFFFDFVYEALLDSAFIFLQNMKVHISIDIGDLILSRMEQFVP